MALAHAIMAFIADHPYSGYDLSKELENSIGCYWMASYQQVYRELAKLESPLLCMLGDNTSRMPSREKVVLFNK